MSFLKKSTSFYTLKCQMGVLIGRGSGKIPKFNKRGVKIHRGLEIEKRLEMVIQGREEQKQVDIEHKTKTFTAVRYFAMKIGRK